MFVVEEGHALPALAQEAALLRAQASQIHEDRRGAVEAMNAFRGRRHHRLATGRMLAQHHEDVLLPRCTALFGRRLLPTRASYMYLGADDHIDFHQDVPTCRYTAAACLAGPPPTLLILPPQGRGAADFHRLLADMPAEALAAQCDRIRLVPGRLVLFEGHAVPHALAPHEGEVTLVAMCFSTVDRDD